MGDSMTDLATLIIPRKLAWEQGEGERIAQIMPGPSNTTQDRSAIGDHEAQDIFNVTMVNGVWELDQRYRQFAPSPSTVTDTVFVSHALPCYLVQSHTGGNPVSQCGAGAVSGACSVGWGYNSGAGLVCIVGSVEPDH